MKELEIRLLEEKEMLKQMISAKEEWENELKKLKKKEQKIKDTIKSLNHRIELNTKIINNVEKEMKEG